MLWKSQEAGGGGHEFRGEGQVVLSSQGKPRLCFICIVTYSANIY